MDTLFFAIQICGLLAIAIWAYRNDLRSGIAEQDGLLAIKLPKPAVDAQPAVGPPPLAGRAPDPGPPASPEDAPPEHGRRPPARRRFISS